MPDLTLQSIVTLKSGAQMPVLGFGLWQSTSPYESALTAIQHGYRHLDSARVYKSEAETAKAASDSGVEDVWMTTKVTCREYARKKPISEAVRDSNGKAEASGRRWDLYLMHDPCGGRAKRLEAWKELERMQKEGTLKAIGVSNFSEKHLQQLAEDGAESVPDVNQIELHPWCQQRPIVDYCREQGIVMQAYCPLVRGTKLDDPTLKRVAERLGRTPAQVLIRWSLSKGFVPLVKSDTPSRIKENAEVFDFELSAEDMSSLDDLDEGAKGACSWNPIWVD